MVIVESWKVGTLVKGFEMTPKFYSAPEINAKREAVYRTVLVKSQNIDGGMIKRISPEDLSLIFELYDRAFFSNGIKEHLKKPMAFSFSKRMTRSAGMTLFRRSRDKKGDPHIEIRISLNHIGLFGAREREKTVGGIAAKDSLTALMLVMEHEMCHVYEWLVSGKSSCSKAPYKILVKGLFGHDQSTHGLVSFKEVAKDQLGLVPGNCYSFLYHDKPMIGLLNKINKNAVMMVPDAKGPYRDQKGQRYIKFYVKPSALRQLGTHEK